MAEQRTLNPQVLGSNPRGRTRSKRGISGLYPKRKGPNTCSFPPPTCATILAACVKGSKTEFAPVVWRLRIYACHPLRFLFVEAYDATANRHHLAHSEWTCQSSGSPASLGWPQRYPT